MFFQSLTMQFSTAFLSSYSKKQLQNWEPVWGMGQNLNRMRKHPKSNFVVSLHPSLPKIIPVLKRMQDYSCLAWKWEAPVFEWGVAARSTWYSHNNGKTTVWWSDGEAKEMDLSGGHSLTLGFFLHLKEKKKSECIFLPCGFHSNLMIWNLSLFFSSSSLLGIRKQMLLLPALCCVLNAPFPSLGS